MAHKAMEGSAEDLAPPPDSWEVVDLEATVSKLILLSSSSSKKGSSPVPLSNAPSSSSASRDGSGQGVIGGVAEDIVVNSVDQFLREASQNPRERLSCNVLTLAVEPTARQNGAWTSQETVRSSVVLFSCYWVLYLEDTRTCRKASNL